MINIEAQVEYKNSMIKAENSFKVALNKAITSIVKGNVSNITFNENCDIRMLYSSVKGNSIRTESFTLSALDSYHLNITNKEGEMCSIFDSELVELYDKYVSLVEQYLEDKSREKLASVLKTDLLYL